MQLTLRLFALISALMGVSLNAQAQTIPPVKPGLWEISFQREVDNQAVLSPNEQAARLSGEERSKLQSMIRRGVVAGDYKSKICLTKDLLANSRWHGVGASCTVKYSQQTGAAWKWHASCPGKETDGQVIFDGPQRYTQAMTSKTSNNGASHVVKVKSTMVWLGADCPGPN